MYWLFVPRSLSSAQSFWECFRVHARERRRETSPALFHCRSGNLPARTRDYPPPVAPEPERNRERTLRLGFGRERPMQHRLQARRRHPLRNDFFGKTQPPMRMLLAQEFKLVRREIDHKQSSARPQSSSRLADRAPAIVKKVQNLMHDHNVKLVAPQREIVDIAFAHRAVLEPRPL